MALETGSRNLMDTFIHRQADTFKSSGINFIAKKLLEGSIAILPTSTVYGVRCIYDKEDLLKRVYKIKQRPANMPFIVLIPGISWLELLSEEVNNTASALINKYWLSENPEPLTLVLKKRSCRKNTENAEQNKTPGQKDTIAIRLDPLPELIKIMKICGPLISTSATISGTDTLPRNISEVPDLILKNVDVVFDYDEHLCGISSSMLDVTHEEPVLLREGGLKYADIIEYLSLPTK